MVSTQVTLHITLQELIEFINYHTEKLGLYIAISTQEHLTVKKVNRLEQADFVNSSHSIFLSNKDIDLNADSKIRYTDVKSGMVQFVTGKLTGESFTQTFVSAFADNDIDLKYIRKIANSLRKLTKKGAMKIGRMDGKQYFLPHIRFTVGAKKLYDEGIIMLTISGGVRYYFVD